MSTSTVTRAPINGLYLLSWTDWLGAERSETMWFAYAGQAREHLLACKATNVKVERVFGHYSVDTLCRLLPEAWGEDADLIREELRRRFKALSATS